MKSYKYFFTALIVLGTKLISAQEIRMNVIIDDNQYTLPANKPIFIEIKSSIENFVNNKIWTEDQFGEKERIKCNLLLTIQPSSSQTGFSCQAQIQSSRPVYGAVYETVLLNYPDKFFNFTYVPSMQMEYNDNAYTTELTSLLAFYCYTMLGLDYDSFGLDGGKSFYVLANQAMNNDPNASSYAGWSNKTNDFTSRYWLIENCINAQFSGFHKSLYQYHIKGLDIIAEKPTEAQKNMLEALKEIEKIRSINQSSILVTSFMLAKRDELVSVYKGANDDLKTEVIPILKSLDPVYSSKYIGIKP